MYDFTALRFHARKGLAEISLSSEVTSSSSKSIHGLLGHVSLEINRAGRDGKAVTVSKERIRHTAAAVCFGKSGEVSMEPLFDPMIISLAH